MELDFLGWRRAREAWGSVAAMLFCIVAGLATVALSMPRRSLRLSAAESQPD